MALLVVGSLALDTIETQTGSATEVPGGSTTYCALAASYFTHPHIVGVVGDDFPDSVSTLFKDHHINLEGMKIEEGKTFRWGGRYSEDFDIRTTLFTHLNVFENFEPTLPETHKDAATVLLANIHPALQLQVLSQLNGNPFVILDTMNLWINTAREELDEVLKQSDMLVINDEESLMLTGKRNYRQAASKLMEMGPEWIVIKKGQHGALLFQQDNLFSLPGLILDTVIDPTGAGDSFVGGLAGYLDQSGNRSFDNMKLGVIYGTILASFCVEDFSVDAMTYLETDDIEERYDELVMMSQF
ncbi:MAG: sugar kinase [Candidatus Marinimicrobia bacterium]|nr:sugar kinase [Candidatus Neomarinimicrobiota bacterium]MCF7851120.1 sugar kinase [Candidatus Neomarinimicrobiota bacterium]MCF7904332.1 sugar kinase [Candidatus Neomarinimicrobiota bacterium]